MLDCSIYLLALNSAVMTGRRQVGKQEDLEQRRSIITQSLAFPPSIPSVGTQHSHQPDFPKDRKRLLLIVNQQVNVPRLSSYHVKHVDDSVETWDLCLSEKGTVVSWVS